MLEKTGKSKRPILITGIHRSGSTWIGSIMAFSKELKYIHEPFNLKKHKNVPFKNWYQYYSIAPTQLNEKKIVKSYLLAFNRFNFKRLIRGIKQSKKASHFKSSILDEVRCFTTRALYKDPIALMSSEWIYKELNACIIISIRHPAAFIASIKVKDWYFDFDNLLRQEYLLNDYLRDFKIEIEEERNKTDIVTTGILLWKMFYSLVFKLQKKYENNSDWIFVKHEELSLDPINKYKSIFSQFELEFTEAIQDEIIRTSTSQKISKLTRNSKKNIHTWKDRLTPMEIDLIKMETQDVWELFYSENDW